MRTESLRTFAEFAAPSQFAGFDCRIVLIGYFPGLSDYSKQFGGSSREIVIEGRISSSNAELELLSSIFALKYSPVGNSGRL